MFALLNPRVWVALALVAVLAVSHAFAYRKGSASTQAKWDAAKVVQQQAQIDAERAARAKEQSLQSKVTEANDAARKRETTLKAAAGRARTELDGLRNENASIRSRLPGLTAAAVRRYADAATDVLDQCSRSYQGLAQEADGLASDSLTLQQAWPK